MMPDDSDIVAVLRYEMTMGDQVELLGRAADHIERLEVIARAFAEESPIEYGGDMMHWCTLCSVALPTRLEHHKPDCPWRLSVEWVAAHPQA